MTDLTDLLGRIEAAEGPSRRLDGDIAEALGLVPSWCVERSVKQGELWRGPGAGLNASTWLAPVWSASLDAALALAERLGYVALINTWQPFANVAKDGCFIAGKSAEAKTPALALLAALFRALIAQQSTERASSRDDQQ